jgi:heme/copper-type cytochrome/quinol oxidase subunit 2
MRVILIRTQGVTVAVRRTGLVLAAALWLFATGMALAEEPTAELTIRNHQFEPAELHVPANTKVKLVIKNADTTPEEFESFELRREKVVAGGQEIIVYVGPLAPGTYEFFGDFNPKTARGHLVVK